MASWTWPLGSKATMLIGIRASPPQTRTRLRQGVIIVEIVWQDGQQVRISQLSIPSIDRSSNDAVVGIIRSMEGEQGDSCVLQG